MKVLLDVIRFHNEDVVATSAITPDQGGDIIIIPDGVCVHVGALHFFTTSRGRYDASTDSTKATGVSYMYNAPGDMTLAPGNTMEIAGRVTIPAGRYYYDDGQGFVLCDLQAHTHSH